MDLVILQEGDASLSTKLPAAKRLRRPSEVKPQEVTDASIAQLLLKI